MASLDISLLLISSAFNSNRNGRIGNIFARDNKINDRNLQVHWSYLDIKKDLFHRGKSTGEHVDITAVNWDLSSKNSFKKIISCNFSLQHENKKCNCYYVPSRLFCCYNKSYNTNDPIIDPPHSHPYRATLLL